MLAVIVTITVRYICNFFAVIVTIRGGLHAVLTAIVTITGMSLLSANSNLTTI